MFFGLTRTPGKVLMDAGVLALAWLLAFALRFGGEIPDHYQAFVLAYLPLAVAVKLGAFSLTGLYRSVWRYTSLVDLIALVRAVAVSWVALVSVIFVLGGDPRFPRGVSVIDAVLALVLAGGVRLAPRLLHQRLPLEKSGGLPAWMRGWLRDGRGAALRPILVVGAGDAGEAVVRLLKHGEIKGYRARALVDDDPQKQGTKIHGVPVLGTTEDVPRLARELACDLALIAIPSARREEVLRIASICREAALEINIVPDLKNLVSGRLSLSDISELNIETLLGREKVDLQVEEAATYLEGRRILVTGAGGSIGSELCRQILAFGPAELVLFGRGENSIFKVYNELYRTGTRTELHQIIGDVINRPKLEVVFARHRPEIVFHAGADKHVPLMESNPDEAVLNNVIGSLNLVAVADEHGADRTVCISTDKAVNPTSIMGCCKRVAELLIQAGDFKRAKTVAVRFGNVLGSRGSVLPLFEEQIARGGPVTVTDRNVVRYFMTIPEAVQLVVQAGAMARGGEIFILEMGEPMRIEDLARNLIKLHGLEPEVEVPITFTGLRPGEKLREELVVPGERVFRTSHPKILRVEPPPRSATSDGSLLLAVRELQDLAVRMDADGIREALQRLVPEYEPYARPQVTTVALKRD